MIYRGAQTPKPLGEGEIEYIRGLCAEEKHGEAIAYLKGKGYKTPTKAMIKTPEQIAGCREAGRINSLVLDAVEREIRVGMTTQDIDDIVVAETKRLGGIPGCLGYGGFPKSVCTSINSVVCHGIPSKKVILREGDIINVDCTTKFEGYFGDASRMFTFGDIRPVAKRLVDVTRSATMAAVEHIKPFTTYLGDIGYIINTAAKAQGFKVVREIGGHGVGLEMHEDPYVCHIGFMGRGIMLLPGMIFTIEPMINEGTGDVYISPDDGWTVYTADDTLSAQVEHEVLVTMDGFEILSK
jgi:methionyl aminopeptidase